MSVSRRAVLATLGTGTLVAGLGWYRWRRQIPKDADAVARALTELPTEQVALTVAGWLAAGLPAKPVFDAAFHAPLVYHCDQSDIHASITALAAYALAQGTPHLNVMACWAAEFSALWLLSPSTQAPAGRPSQLSMDGAIQAGPDFVHGIASRSTPEQIRSAVLAHAGQSLADPHGMIYAAQVLRGLEHFGTRHARRVLTSVAARLSRVDDALRNRYHRLLSIAEDVSAKRPLDRMSANLLRHAFWSPAVEFELGPRVRQGLGLHTLALGVQGAALDSASLDSSASGDGVHALILTDASHAIAQRAGRPEWAARVFLSAAVLINERRSALKQAPRPETPAFNVADRARVYAANHLVDPHHVICAQAIRGLATAPHRPDDFDGRITQTPLFRAVGDWDKRAVVIDRLGG